MQGGTGPETKPEGGAKSFTVLFWRAAAATTTTT